MTETVGAGIVMGGARTGIAVDLCDVTRRTDSGHGLKSLGYAEPERRETYIESAHNASITYSLSEIVCPSSPVSKPLTLGSTFPYTPRSEYLDNLPADQGAVSNYLRSEYLDDLPASQDAVRAPGSPAGQLQFTLPARLSGSPLEPLSPAEGPAVPFRLLSLDASRAKAHDTANGCCWMSSLSPAALGASARRGEVLVLGTATGYHVVWRVDFKRLNGREKVAVSPQFEVGFRETTPFRIMIRPRTINNFRGGACFSRSKGRGSIQVKCEATSSELSAGCLTSLRMAACKGIEKVWRKIPRGPITHDFALNGVCGLPPGEDTWNFREFMHDATATFIVYVQIVPLKAWAETLPTTM